MIQKRPTFAPKPIRLSSESAPFSSLCKYPLPFHVLVSASLFYFVRKSKHFCNVILLFKIDCGRHNVYAYKQMMLSFYRYISVCYAKIFCSIYMHLYVSECGLPIKK